MLIDRLIALGLENGLIKNEDIIYIKNRILAMLKKDEPEKFDDICTLNLYDTLDAICEIAIKNGIIDDNLQAKDIFSSTIMNLFLDKPSVVNEKFWSFYKMDNKVATDWFYNQSKSSNYIKVDRIAKNKVYNASSKYGNLVLTINLSKPEKDPKQIALEKLAPSSSYPKCLLCVENEGYEGRINHPDRANHRMIRMQLNNRDWCMQYSPYLYYNEHCIVLSTSHIPMQINEETFKTLLDFTTVLPHYFIGSNADLPIVGGSILSHEHYQGGNYTFPMTNANKLFDIELDDQDVKAHAINWPLSTIRLTSVNKTALVKTGTRILNAWRNYSDAEQDILSNTNGTPHNTVTPICRRRGENYEMDLVLRNNRQTDEFPDGIFHPHKDVHHIKKENIGLIEVMGLAVLPGRLLEELTLVKNYILGKSNEVADYHKAWADELKFKYSQLDDIEQYVVSALGDKFSRVLEDAGVFKLNETGIAAFQKFTKCF